MPRREHCGIATDTGVMNTSTIAAPVATPGYLSNHWQLVRKNILRYGAHANVQDGQVLSNIPFVITTGAPEHMLAANIIERALCEFGFDGPLDATGTCFQFTRTHAPDFAEHYIGSMATPEKGIAIRSECITDFLLRRLGFAAIAA